MYCLYNSTNTTYYTSANNRAAWNRFYLYHTSSIYILLGYAYCLVVLLFATLFHVLCSL